MQRVSHKAAALQRHSELLLLPGGVGACLQVLQGTAAAGAEEGTGRIGAMGGGLQQLDDFALKADAALAGQDRKSVVSGKSVSVSVDLGGSRIMKKKNKKYISRSLNRKKIM